MASSGDRIGGTNLGDLGTVSRYSVELGFKLDSRHPQERRKRLVLIAEGFKAIAHRDERLVSWHQLPYAVDDWVHVQATLSARWPGEAAEIGETWLAAAIASADVSGDSLTEALAQRTDQSPPAWIRESLGTITAQVDSGPPR